MTQARIGTAFSLTLTPLQFPEATPTPELVRAFSGAPMEGPPAPLGLLLRPGEPSELLVQIRSQRRASLQLQIQVEGSFPLEWCRIGTEGSALASGQQMDAVLHFAIAPTFFEQPLSSESLPLQLDYSGRLVVTSIDPETQERYAETRPFQLHVRPRSLYPDFLPEIYRDVDFIGRFLKIFEQSFEPAVHSLETLWAYLDPLTAPQALLPFLAHWVGWSFEAPITSDRQRFLIRHAMEIYRWRGTRRGLRFYLHLATGLSLDEHCHQESEKHIGIYETFHQGCVVGVARIGEDAIIGGTRPYHFNVCLRPDAGVTIDEALVRRIIEQEKPAFCSYDLRIEQPPQAGSPALIPAPPR